MLGISKWHEKKISFAFSLSFGFSVYSVCVHSETKKNTEYICNKLNSDDKSPAPLPKNAQRDTHAEDNITRKTENTKKKKKKMMMKNEFLFFRTLTHVKTLFFIYDTRMNRAFCTEPLCLCMPKRNCAYSSMYVIFNGNIKYGKQSHTCHIISSSTFIFYFHIHAFKPCLLAQKKRGTRLSSKKNSRFAVPKLILTAIKSMDDNIQRRKKIFQKFLFSHSKNR